MRLDYDQKKKDGYLVAIPCQEYTINGETYTAIGSVYDHSKLDSMLKLKGYDGKMCIRDRRTSIRQNIDYRKQLIKIFILLFGKLQILFKLIGKLNVVFHTSRAALSASILE